MAIETDVVVGVAVMDTGPFTRSLGERFLVWIGVVDDSARDAPALTEFLIRESMLRVLQAGLAVRFEVDDSNRLGWQRLSPLGAPAEADLLALTADR